MQRCGKKLNSFAVMPTRNGRNIVVEINDLDECVRPSVEKDIHIAVRRLMHRMHTLYHQTEQGEQHAVHQITTPIQG
jgi:hypothetical protein